MFMPAYSLDWVSRCQIRLVTSNFGTSTGTICVLFDDSYSYDDGNTLSSSLIDNRQIKTDINTSFVDSDSWPGLRVCAAVDGRQGATPRSSTSSIWSRWYRPHRFVRICLAFNWFESICLLFTVYDYCTIKQCSYDMFIILKYNTHRVDRWSLFQPNIRVTIFYHYTQPYATSSISSLDNEHTMLLRTDTKITKHFKNVIGSLGHHQKLTHCWHYGTRHTCNVS